MKDRRGINEGQNGVSMKDRRGVNEGQKGYQ